MLLLTKSTTFIIGPVASLLGYIMNGLYWLQSQIGLENIGLCIILFTIVIYMLMLPLTVQQQKFSRLSSRMNPEIQAVQKKYKGKQDQVSMQKMNEETQAIYAKYGVNPMGSCLQLVIQTPILFALYRVIWNIPAYVTSVREAFLPLADKILMTDGAMDIMSGFASKVGVSFKEMTSLTLVDVLYKFKPANWSELASSFPDLSSMIGETQHKVDKFNYFLGLNIADSPMSIITTAAKSGAVLMIIGAVLIPVLAAVTQWLNARLMTSMQKSQAVGKEKKAAENSMENSMKMMNNLMPIMSAVFCLSLPVGMGLYWIAGAVVRSIQQVAINKKIDAMDMEEILKKNMEKLNKKREKQGLPPQKMNANAKINTRNISANNADNTAVKNVQTQKSQKAKLADEAAKISETKSSQNAKPGSLASKAMMVKDYNDKNGKR